MATHAWGRLHAVIATPFIAARRRSRPTSRVPSQARAFVARRDDSARTQVPCRSAAVKLRYKILIGVVAVFGVAFAALVITVSYDSPCPPIAAQATGADSMRAVMSRCYGVPQGV